MLGIVPFALLLLGIAVLPLAIPHAWEKNRNKAIFCAILAIPTAAYILANDPHLLQHAALEYFSFIVLLASLFISAGGVVLEGDLPKSTWANAALLAFGSVLASVIGTTGASMLLLRPMLRANRGRTFVTHVPIFFIFMVSNAGGLLTPLGDPPLFLGFLRGVPFTWTFKLFPEWLFVNLALAAIFVAVDLAKNRAPSEKTARAPLKLRGLHNLALLTGIVLAAAFLPFGAREAAMIAIAAASYFLTKKELHASNGFTFGPINEVAILFAGIFVTMAPALAFLQSKGPELGVQTAREFFFVSGALSSVLDNAPTYLTFFTIAQTMAVAGQTLVAGVPEHLLIAISLGSVFMGANTYIGNGPNFMVKAIAEENGYKMPSFFGYIAWSASILFPLWIVVAFLFIA